MSAASRLMALAILGMLVAGGAKAEIENFSGVYKSILQYSGSKYFQHADITLRSVQTAEGFKPLATVKVIFGDRTSNEYITYEYDQVNYDPVFGVISMTSEKNDLSFKGVRKISTGTIEGEWASSVLGGKVGTFFAKGGVEGPKAPEDATPVRTLTGHYRGEIVNTSPESNIPPRVSVSLVATQEITPTGPLMKTSGKTRLYWGDFGSLDYIELNLVEINFNFYNRVFSAKTEKYGLTYKGTMSLEGILDGKVYADGIGEAATIQVKQQ